MSYKLQLFPLSSTEAILKRLPAKIAGEMPANVEDARFLRSWLVYDSEIQRNRTTGRSNRSIALGLTVAICLSAFFWTGIGLMLARMWR